MSESNSPDLMKALPEAPLETTHSVADSGATSESVEAAAPAENSRETMKEAVVTMAPNMGGTTSPTTAAPMNTDAWQVIGVKTRVDSFNQDELIAQIRALKEQGAQRIALDLKNNRFLSLPVIKACVEVAKDLADQKGFFALVSCPEKTKRHFEIYGSLKHIRVVRSDRDLDAPPRLVY